MIPRPGGLMASATVRRSSQFLGRVLSYLGGQDYNFGGKSIRENDVELGCSFHEIITGELEHPQSCTSIKENICSSHLNLEQECQRKALDSTTCDLLSMFREKSLFKGKRAHASIMKGASGDFSMGNILQGYATCGSIGDVCTLFNNMFERNVVSWNTMIGIYARSQDVLELLYDMKVEGILPNTFTFITILNAFDTKLSQSKIRFTHSHIVNSKLDSDMAIQSALISTYGESSQFNDAKVVFDRIRKHDARSWTAMIKTYGHNGLSKGAIDLYWEMTKEGIVADKRVIMSVLHVVSMCTMPCHGKQIHACILFSHFKMDIFVLNMLLNMYGKFGLPRVAWDIFVKTDKLNIVSWNSIIATYTQNGHRMEALQLFLEMVSGHMMPDRVTFITILDVFSGSCALAVGKWVHSFILAIKLDAEISVGNALLNMYKKCGSWEGSVIVFDHMPVVSVVSWTVMVALCIQHGYDKFAIQCLLHMQLQSLRPNKVTFVTLVDAYTSGKFLPSGRMVHACVIKNGVELADVGTCLINMYGRCGSTMDAQLIFHRLQDRNVISWNAVTTALLCNSLYHEALQHFYQMHSLEIAPDEVTFSLIFPACEVLAEGKKLHACFIHNALNGDSIIDTALVDMYGKLGSMEDVWKIFNRINEKDTPSWNVMISLCALHKHGREALSAFRSMLLENMVPDNFTYVSLLDACGSQSMLGEGKCIHSLIIEYGYESDVYISNALISMYGNCGKLHDARDCFERMLPRNAISWTAITSVHAQHGYGGEALRFFHEMHSDGHAPDVVSLVSILSACRHGGLTNEACYFFVSVSQDYSIKQTMEHYNCMICLLRQTESMDIAEDLMNYMPFVLTPLSWSNFF